MRNNYRKTVCYFLFALTILGTQASIAQVSEERTVVVAPAKVIKRTVLAPSTLTQRTRQVEETFQKKVDFDFDEAAMNRVLQILTAETGVNFQLTQSAQDDLLTDDELITCGLKSITLHTAMRAMLSKYNATYVIQSGIVLIISKEDRESSHFLRTKMFDCRNLISKMDPTVLMAGNAKIFAAKCDSLMKTVELTVAPGTWKKKDNSGFATMHNFSGILIVTTTEDKLRSVENILVDLHARFGVTMPDQTKADTSKASMVLSAPSISNALK